MKENLVGKATIEVIEPLKKFFEMAEGCGDQYWDTGRYTVLILDNHMEKLDKSLQQKEANQLTSREISDIDQEIVGCRREKLDLLTNLRNSAFQQYFIKDKAMSFGEQASQCAV